jgi:hypothetical protein
MTSNLIQFDFHQWLPMAHLDLWIQMMCYVAAISVLHGYG